MLCKVVKQHNRNKEGYTRGRVSEYLSRSSHRSSSFWSLAKSIAYSNRRQGKRYNDIHKTYPIDVS
jgi:hypothetical protein